MRFYYESESESEKTVKNKYPFCQITRSSWNDWGYYATFFLVCFVDETQSIDFGALKIGKSGLETPDYYNGDKEYVDLEPTFVELNKDYFSVGGSSEYYKKMYKLGQTNTDLQQEILAGLRDIVNKDSLYSINENEDIFRKSLIRNSSKKTIKEVFRQSLDTGFEELTPYDFSIQLKNELFSQPMTFSVSPKKLPQSNIHTIIGRNGVGKTNLFRSIIGELSHVEIPEDTDVIETFDGKEKISSVLALSYSIFDTTLPKEDNFKNDIPYKFIGFGKKGESLSKPLDKIIEDQFLNVVDSIRMNEDLSKILGECIQTLNSDPMFCTLNVMDWFSKKNISNLKTLYSKLSSGHKIVLLSLLQIINNVEPNSLFLIDEPELNLHPPLISSFIQAILVILRKRNAVAIIATHSPVIVQECSSDCVWIIDRSVSNITIKRPTLKTFGENVGLITYDVFSLEVKNSGYMKIIKDAISEYDKSFFGQNQNVNESLKFLINEFNNKLGDESVSNIANILSLKRK